jgi:hypothetical protein
MNPSFQPKPWQLHRVFETLSRHADYLTRLRCRMIEVGFAEDVPLRIDVERAFEAIQKLKGLLSPKAAERESLPAPEANGAAGAELSNEQCRQIVDGLFPLANYVCRLKTRFQRRRLHHEDPLSVAAAEVQDAMQRLRMSFTYRATKRKSTIIPWDDPRAGNRGGTE